MNAQPLHASVTRCARRKRRWPCVPPLICTLLAGAVVFGPMALFCYLIFGLR